MDWITICITGKRLADSGFFFGGGGGGEGGRVLTKVLYGDARPEVQPLTFYIQFLTETIALSYTFH